MAAAVLVLVADKIVRALSRRKKAPKRKAKGKKA